MTNLAEPRGRTRQVTLQKLASADLYEAIDAVDFDARFIPIQEGIISVDGFEALWIAGTYITPVAEWCGDAQVTVQKDIALGDRRSAGLLVIDVAGEVYAIGYGQGHRLLDEESIDQRFGISFAVRTLDQRELHDLTRRRPGAKGRTDSTVVPAGLPIWAFGIEDSADLVRRAGGRISGLGLTYAGEDQEKPIRIEASIGLQIRLGVQGRDLISDIQAISRTVRDREPAEGLEFVERIVPVHDRRTCSELDARLDELLSVDAETATEHLTPVVPTIRLEDYLRAATFQVNIGTPGKITHDLDLELFVSKTRRRSPGARHRALANGRVMLYADDRGDDPVGPAGGTPAHKWIEANVSLEARRYSYVDGSWYEIGATYLDGLREKLTALFDREPSVELPAWALSDDEKGYNLHVQHCLPGSLCLDRRGSRRVASTFRG